ncbi:MAG: LCP family protein [Oscillospiraceae bacterium]|nr:LCP family protein [Oscillospiraceae bacterium]
MKLIGSRGNGRRVANGNHKNARTPTNAGSTVGVGVIDSSVTNYSSDDSDFFDPSIVDAVLQDSGMVNINDTDYTTNSTPNLNSTSTKDAKNVKRGTKKQRPIISRKEKIRKRLLVAGSVILLLASAIVVVLFTPLWDTLFRPDESILARPEISRPTFSPGDVDNPLFNIDSEDNGFNAIPIEQLRSMDRFTFLIQGIDGTGNTDVIMVATFDSENHTLEVVNIPRDTIVNVSWNVRKANSIHAVMRNRYRNEDNPQEAAMAATVAHFRNLLGFNVDFWVTINMRAFINLVDAIGGVEFDVPVGMNWSDPESNLHFNLSRGQQRVNGNNALGLMRFRNYAEGDLTRIAVQQDFLLATAQQLLAGVNAGNITTFAETFLTHVTTDLQLTSLAWLGREFLNMSTEDINFTTMPTVAARVRGGSYQALVLDEWMEIVNTRLNPLTREITTDDVSILTRGSDNRLFVTDGNWQGSSNWGGG